MEQLARAADEQVARLQPRRGGIVDEAVHQAFALEILQHLVEVGAFAQVHAVLVHKLVGILVDVAVEVSILEIRRNARCVASDEEVGVDASTSVDHPAQPRLELFAAVAHTVGRIVLAMFGA